MSREKTCSRVVAAEELEVELAGTQADSPDAFEIECELSRRRTMDAAAGQRRLDGWLAACTFGGLAVAVGIILLAIQLHGRPALERRCASGDLDACIELAVSLHAHEPERALAIYELACRSGKPLACDGWSCVARGFKPPVRVSVLRLPPPGADGSAHDDELRALLASLR